MSIKHRYHFFLHHFILSILGVAWLILCAADVRALDSRKAATQYIHDVWTTREGLPQDTINSLVQDGDGYIWFGTQEGLVRFDGVSFTVFDSRNTDALNANNIPVVFVDGKGVPWVGASDGLIHYRDGSFEFYGEKNGLPSDSNVKNISEDAAGNLWLGYSSSDKKSGGDGLGRFKDGQVRIFTVKDGLSNNQIKKTFPDKQGNLWIAASNGLNLLKDGKFTNYTVADGLSDNTVRTVCGDRAGNLWIGTANGLNRFKDGGFTVYTTKDGLSNNGILSVFEDRDGILWIGTDSGLNRMIDGKIQAVKGIEGLATDEIHAFMEDTEGSLWIGTHTNGLHRLRDGKFTAYGSPEGLLGDSVDAIFEDGDGRILIGTNPGGLSVLSDGRFQTYSVAEGLLSDKIRTIAQDGEGDFWIGTYKGLNRFKGEKFAAYTTKDGLTNESVRSFYEDTGGMLWIGTNGGGLNLFASGKFVPFPNFDEFHTKFIQAIRKDRTGRIWVGMDEETGYFKDGAFTFYPDEALNKANVQSICEDADGVLWFATWGQGLLRLKNEKLTVFTSKDGLFDNTQWSILDDGAGNLWMGSNRGIFRVSRAELDDVAEGRIEKVNSVVYGAADGMRKSETNVGNPSALRSRDGRLWFSTTAGAVVIDPKNIKINRVPPPVVLQQFSVDEKVIPANEDLIVPPNARGIEIRYAGLSFIQPAKMKYKYKLEGFDTDWIEAGTRHRAFYTNLPPGEYVFQVIAANADGVWNEQGATLKFRALASFWRTRWFYGLCFLAIAGIAFLFYNWRVTKLKREKLAQQTFSQQLIESQETERKRIAVELHDGLGQNLVIIKNRALIGLNAPENHERMLAQMTEISEAVSATIAEVRGIARNLHPYQIEYLGLTTALKAMIKTAAEASNVEFSIEIDELGKQLQKAVEINLYRIAQEAVNNILKHSQATKASVVFGKNGRSLDVTIEDNGIGFALDSVNTNRGLGLVGIGERAKMLDAQYEINSTEKGTTIRLQMNLPA